MSVQDNVKRPSDIMRERLTYGRVTPTNVPDVNDITISPDAQELQGNAHLRQAAEQARQQVATPLQTSDGKPENKDNTEVLRSQGVASWLKANYPKDDYDQRIKDMRRQKAVSTLGNLATVLGQAAALGIGARSFDKVQDKSAQYDEYIQKLKDAQLNYNLNRANAMYSAVNADAQRQATAEEADKARKYNAEEAAKTRAYNYDLAKRQAEIDANKQAVKMMFEADQNEKNRQNNRATAYIRSSNNGSNKYYGSVTIDGKKQDFTTAADYNKAVIEEAKRLGIDTKKTLGGINPDGSGYGSREVSEKVYELAAEIEKRAKDEKKPTALDNILGD